MRFYGLILATLVFVSIAVAELEGPKNVPQDGFIINITNNWKVEGVARAVNDLIAEGFTIRGMAYNVEDNRIFRIYVNKGKCQTLEEAKSIVEKQQSLMMVWPQLDTFPVDTD